MTKRVTIKIPEPLYQRLKKIIDGTGFASVTEFVVYVLRDLAAAHDAHDATATEPTEAELRVIVERLRSLGYID
jgi:hypothetical protein